MAKSRPQREQERAWTARTPSSTGSPADGSTCRETAN